MRATLYGVSAWVWGLYLEVSHSCLHITQDSLEEVLTCPAHGDKDHCANDEVGFVGVRNTLKVRLGITAETGLP